MPDNGSRLLGSCPSQNPRCTRPHPGSPDGGNPETDRRVYVIEAEIKGMLAEQRLAERQQKAKPLLKSL